MQALPAHAGCSAHAANIGCQRLVTPPLLAISGSSRAVCSSESSVLSGTTCSTVSTYRRPASTRCQASKQPPATPAVDAPKKQAVCYGCGAKLQTLIAAGAGYVKPEKYAIKKQHRQLNKASWEPVCGAAVSSFCRIRVAISRRQHVFYRVMCFYVSLLCI